jgi:hypothetical protein
METQLNLDVLRETPIDEEWILKYPPARVGSEILACKFESIDISSDMIALVIENADSWIDRYAPSVDYTRCIDIGAVAVSWGVLAISPVWNRIPDLILAHACGRLRHVTCSGVDVNSQRYPRIEAKIESRDWLDDGIPLLVTTYLAERRTEVKLARDIQIITRFGCVV